VSKVSERLKQFADIDTSESAKAFLLSAAEEIEQLEKERDDLKQQIDTASANWKLALDERDAAHSRLREMPLPLPPSDSKANMPIR
jgi:hypothetical protein